jgi:hypothetical protein
MRDSAADIATVLAGAGLSLTNGTNLFLGPMPEDDDTVPDKCVAVLQTGGGAPLGFIGGGKKAFVSVSCQIRVRGDREDFQAGQTLACGILEALNQTAPSPYVAIRVRESAPFYGGTDSADRPQWSLNVVLQYVNAPS